jgi:hypothetical protein
MRSNAHAKGEAAQLLASTEKGAAKISWDISLAVVIAFSERHLRQWLFRVPLFFLGQLPTR